MIGRALGVWLGILLLANLNGAIRALWLIPSLGEVAGRAVSTLILCALALLITWLTIEWIGPMTTGEALLVGALWLVLTLAFEFLVGHYGFHKSWAELLEDYDLSRGRIWPLVLLVVLLAPLWTARWRSLWP